MAEEEAAAPDLRLQFQDGQVYLADTSITEQLPMGYPVDAPFIRSERIFGLLDDYRRVHAQYERGDDDAVPDIAAWGLEFMEKVVTDTDTLHDLFLAAWTLGIYGLRDLCAQMTADLVKGRTVGEVKQLLGITDVGMTPDEEQELQRNNQDILRLR
ncbi:uncharacterized protein LOC102702906 [Oryza brachyantha]|uniref:SKP1 component dimerisation domain-containing protein n=1 Tax=Oryza brachyantha TaxID=4533 RepID=J3NEN1_ORYBR|nr:uncharacterized protein LOC102702906 [Oryza brachyantha]